MFLAGLAWHITDDILWRDFGECGVIEDLFLMRDQSGESKGRALLTFRDKAGATAALAFNETNYGGRTLYVKEAEEKRKTANKDPGDASEASKKPQKAPADEDAKPEKPEGCVSLCLKNLDKEATEDDVRGLFAGCKVQAFRLVYDRDTGESRGVAFVDFAKTEDVDKAMEFNGAKVKGKAVVMKYEFPKVRPRPDGCMSVVVKKLGPDASEAELCKLFKGLTKQITEVRVITETGTNKCNGMAFVDFSTAKATETAVARSGCQVQGKTIFIGYETKTKAPPKEKTDGAKRKGKVNGEGKTAKADDAEPKGKKAKKAVVEPVVAERVVVPEDPEPADEIPGSSSKTKGEAAKEHQLLRRKAAKLKKKEAKSGAAQAGGVTWSMADADEEQLDDAPAAGNASKKKRKKGAAADTTEPAVEAVAEADATPRLKKKKRKAPAE